MDEFELIFVTDPIDDTLEDLLLEQGDSIERHGRLTQVLTVAEGEDPVEVALGEANRLQALGIRVRRFALDLVNMVGIADHANVSKQAVQRWISDATFPVPYASQGSLLWAWRDVFDWIVTNRPGHKTPTTPVGRLDAQRFDLIWESESTEASPTPLILSARTHPTGQWGVKSSGQMTAFAFHAVFERPNVGVVSGRWDEAHRDAMLADEVGELSDVR
jgi:hypothetical protein